MKDHLRREYRLKRHQITVERRQEAHEKVHTTLTSLVATYALVLSYAAFDGELQTDTINTLLAQAGKLILPKVEGEGLALYHVENCEKQLQKNSWGILEPIPELCRHASPESVSLALVPGLAFDHDKQRLGYGKGYYDKLLPHLLPSAQTYGLCFVEQISPSLLPVAAHDVALQDLLSF